MLTIRNIDNTINWDGVPNDVIQLIIRQCSIIDRFTLSQVNKRFKHLVLSMSPDLVNIYKTVKRSLPPKIDFSESIIDNLDTFANKIEYIPIIGTVISIIRCLGGCFLFGHWQASKCAYSDPIDISICDMNKERAFRNFGGGYIRMLPLVGVCFNAILMDELSLDKVQAHAVKCLKGIREYSRWKKQVKGQVLPMLKFQEKREILIKLLNQIPSKDSVNNDLRSWVSANMHQVLRDRYKDLLIRIASIVAAVCNIERELLDLG